MAIFSRYFWSIPLKVKTVSLITTALKHLFQNRKRISILPDKSTEFVNATVQQYLKRQGVGFHTTHNPYIKGAIVERFQNITKTRIFKYFIKNNTYNYLYVKTNFNRLQQLYTYDYMYACEQSHASNIY